MKINKFVVLAGFAIASTLFSKVAARADETDQSTKITFSAPVEIPGQPSNRTERDLSAVRDGGTLRLPKNFWLYALAAVVIGVQVSLGRRKQVHDGTPPPITANFTVNATSDSTTAATSLSITAR